MSIAEFWYNRVPEAGFLSISLTPTTRKLRTRSRRLTDHGSELPHRTDYAFRRVINDLRIPY